MFSRDLTRKDIDFERVLLQWLTRQPNLRVLDKSKIKGQKPEVFDKSRNV